MKIVYDPNEVLALFATHSAVEVGIIMQFVLYAEGASLTEHQMDAITERIIAEYSQICGRETAERIVNEAIHQFAQPESLNRMSFLTDVFKSVG
jgi:hypothetical protein